MEKKLTCHLQSVLRSIFLSNMPHVCVSATIWRRRPPLPPFLKLPSAVTRNTNFIAMAAVLRVCIHCNIRCGFLRIISCTCVCICVCVCVTHLGTSKIDRGDRKRGLKMERNTKHTQTYIHPHTHTQSSSLSLIKTAKNGDLEVTNTGGVGQAHKAKHHGKSRPISTEACD